MLTLTQPPRCRSRSIFANNWPFEAAFRDFPVFKHFDTDVIDADTHYDIQVDLPGVDKEDVNITLEDGVLTISGMRKSTETDGNDNYLKSERHVGKFSRSFKLPEEIDTNKVDASLANGVLSITVGKSEDTRPKRIEVK